MKNFCELTKVAKIEDRMIENDMDIMNSCQKDRGTEKIRFLRLSHDELSVALCELEIVEN